MAWAFIDPLIILKGNNSQLQQFTFDGLLLKIKKSKRQEYSCKIDEFYYKILSSLIQNQIINECLYNSQNLMGKKILRKGKKPSKSLTQLYDKITQIETDILNRLQKLKLLPKLKLCQHLNNSINLSSVFDPQTNYYDQYWRRFSLNEIGKGQVKIIAAQISYISKRLHKIDQLFKFRQQLLDPFEKKKARSYQEQQIHNYPLKQFDDVQALFSLRQIKQEKIDERPIPSKEEYCIYEQLFDLDDNDPES